MTNTKRTILKLKPSARDKRRYFLVTATHESIEKTLLEYLGILGLARAAYEPVKIKTPQKKYVGSCLAKSLNDVKTALAFKKITIEKVSGTLKGLTK